MCRDKFISIHLIHLIYNFRGGIELRIWQAILRNRENNGN